MVRFEYFDDPVNYSYITDQKVECSICGSNEICFDGGGFYGEKEIEAICPRCLSEGKLIQLGISTNEVGIENCGKLKNIIECCTPKLPTWQDHIWPYKNSDFCRFIKIASKKDYTGPADLFNSIEPDMYFGRDENEFWEMLPDSIITCLSDGNYDTSFYLFMAGTQKVTTWDCN